MNGAMIGRTLLGRGKCLPPVTILDKIIKLSKERLQSLGCHLFVCDHKNQKLFNPFLPIFSLPRVQRPALTTCLTFQPRESRAEKRKKQNKQRKKQKKKQKTND
jgi:hypothetical protein